MYTSQTQNVGKTRKATLYTELLYSLQNITSFDFVTSRTQNYQQKTKMNFHQNFEIQNEQKLRYGVALMVEELRIQTYHVIKQNAENMVQSTTSKYPSTQPCEENVVYNKSGFHKSTRCYNDLCMLK